MVLCSTPTKRVKVNMNFLLKLLASKNFYHICYHPSHLIATFWEAIFALREKIEKNRANGRVINSKGDTKFSRYCPKDLLFFPKDCFGLSKSPRNPPWVQELLSFSIMYSHENALSSWKATFSKIYHGDYLYYPKGNIPQECVETKTKQINGKFHFFLSH